MRVLRKGATRNVIMLEDKVIKFPKMYNRGTFRLGITANKREMEVFKSMPDNPKLCPILNDGDDLFVVMPRARTNFTEHEIKHGLYDTAFHDITWDTHNGNKGFLGDRLVLIDYGMDDEVDMLLGRHYKRPKIETFLRRQENPLKIKVKKPRLFKATGIIAAIQSAINNFQF